MQERREFYRIRDQIYLDCQPFSAEQQSSTEAKALDHLLDGLSDLDSELLPLLRRMEQRDPELGNCLRTLNCKMMLLAHHSLLKSEQPLEDLPQISVNLSAGGLAFISDKPFTHSSCVRLKMFLPASATLIDCKAKVVDCSKMDIEGQWRISLRYEKMEERDREQLARHVALKQSSRFRKKPLSRPSSSSIKKTTRTFARNL